MLENYACYDKNSAGKMFSVGRLKPNDFGLFDMHGNAWEWCQDVYRPGSIAEEKVEDLTISDDQGRVLRGGSFDDVAGDLRAAFRLDVRPGFRWSYNGFRVARTYP